MSQSTTPVHGSSAQRSSSRNRRPSSRPTTPLRPSSRSSLREGRTATGRPIAGDSSQFPLESLEPAFAELSDSMADLEANFMHLQLMHDSLARFNFPEAPIADSFKRARYQDDSLSRSVGSDKLRLDFDTEATFMTTDTSFVDNPPTSSKTAAKFSTPAPSSKVTGGLPRGNVGNPCRGGLGRGTGRGTRGSGLARAKGRGVR